jgi:hypothetical protein
MMLQKRAKGGGRSGGSQAEFHGLPAVGKGKGSIVVVHVKLHA